MALFTEIAADAVKSAIAMLSNLDKLNKERVKTNKPTISIGIGINTGSVMLGTLGVADRLEGSVIGDTVNIAARLEELTKLYKIPLLISADTEKNLENLQIARREIDYVEVKGKERKVSIFEVYQWETKEKVRLKNKLKYQFAKGLEFYRSNKYKDCLKTFQTYKKELLHDSIADLYIERCNLILKK